VLQYLNQASGGGKTYCPLEEKAHLIEGATPKFAKTLSSKYAQAAALTNNRWNTFWRKISMYGVKIEADCAA
jgi:hypothetical protein